MRFVRTYLAIVGGFMVVLLVLDMLGLEIFR